MMKLSAWSAKQKQKFMERNKPLRIIFDTNWYISHIITGRPEVLDTMLIDDNFEIIISPKQEEEFEKVITYPKIAATSKLNLQGSTSVISNKEVFAFLPKRW